MKKVKKTKWEQKSRKQRNDDYIYTKNSIKKGNLFTTFLGHIDDGKLQWEDIMFVSPNTKKVYNCTVITYVDKYMEDIDSQAIQESLDLYDHFDNFIYGEDSWPTEKEWEEYDKIRSEILGMPSREWIKKRKKEIHTDNKSKDNGCVVKCGLEYDSSNTYYNILCTLIVPEKYLTKEGINSAIQHFLNHNERSANTKHYTTSVVTDQDIEDYNNISSVPSINMENNKGLCICGR